MAYATVIRQDLVYKTYAANVLSMRSVFNLAPRNTYG